MTFQGTYIGWGIKINISELVNIFKSEEDNIERITDYEFNSYEEDDCNCDYDYISDIYMSLANCASNNKIFGLNLCVLQQPHEDTNIVYIGDFILVSDNDFGVIKIDNTESEKLKNVLMNSSFKNICLEHFKEEAELLSISVGCFCCT